MKERNRSFPLRSIRRSSGCSAGERGVTLLETLIVAAIAGMLGVVAAGAVNRLLESSSTWSLAVTVKALIQEAATRAVIERQYVGLVVRQTEKGAYAQLFADGDWDGITSEDIASGKDKPLGSRFYLKEERAYLGIPEGATRDPEGAPLAGTDPVRFGRGDILSFSPTATATPGTLYIRDQSGKEGWAFRVAGLGGRVRAYRWWKGKWHLEGRD